MDQNAKQQIIDRLKQASNVLVTVSANPSVDQLAACIGMTLFLNKLGKHGTAVFSGKVPSTLEFLKPEQTIETNTNSLRDFIIALDKSKADKLRYKVEDKIVKIFITPYRTSLSDKDLEFSQGDFNVDVVIGLGVREREDMDQAIMAHGRILHDATVISVNNKDQGNLGTINWVELTASSLSEMLVELCAGLGANKVDAPMATAFLTGIVAETNRFSNDKTSAQTMTIASELMSAGANQQLIASQLEAAASKPAETNDKTGGPVKLGGKADAGDTGNADITADEDGSLHISHEEEKPGTADDGPSELPPLAQSLGGVKHNLEPDANSADMHDDSPSSTAPNSAAAKNEPAIIPTALGSNPSSPASDLALPPIPTDFPKLGRAEDRRPTQEEDMTRLNDIAVTPASQAGKLSANTEPEHLQLDPSTDPLSMPVATSQPPLLNRSNFASSIEASTQPATTSPAGLPTMPFNPPTPVSGVGKTPPPNLQNLDSPKPIGVAHNDAKDEPSENVEEAREAVDEAIREGSADQRLEPLQAMGSQRVDLDNLTPSSASPSASPIPPEYHPSNPDPMSNPSSNPGLAFSMPQPMAAPAVNPTSGLPSSLDTLVPPVTPVDTTAGSGSPTAPPPVPPPLMPPTDVV